MTALATYDIQEGIGLLTIDSPPVNALSAALRKAICEGFERFAQDENVRAIVLVCAGRTFFAGADISEFGKPPQQPTLHDVLNTVEASTKPVIAAIHGTALGGGLELALVCQYRVATASSRLGLPEVKLGILPGAGGTQRLTRLVGAERTLDLITSGRHASAAEMLDWGVLDAIAQDGELRRVALAFAQQVLREGRPLQRVRDRDDRVVPDRGKPEIFASFRAKNARAFRGFMAPARIIECVEAAVELPFDEGMARERAAFLDLVGGVQSAAQRYAFFAEREAAKAPDIDPGAPTLAINRVGIVGAGTMGGGIAMNFLNMGLPVTLVEANPEALERGIGIIRENYEATARKGRISVQDVELRMRLITPSVDVRTLADADLIIEAVFEKMAVKKEVFAKLDEISKAGAILASNTSYLDLDEIARATQRPQDVVGLHFFSPANVMRLLEIVRGKATATPVIATALNLAKQIGKVPVISRVGFGFIANRLMSPRSRQADALVLQGPAPQDIDAAIYNYGFAMGPFQMSDLVGLDVISREGRTLRGDLVAMGRLGQKKNGGFYDYDDNRNPSPSAAAAKVIAAFVRDHNIAQRGTMSEQDIVAHLLYPVVNEGVKILEEGIAMRASDIDLAAIMGYNWPVYTGGPMFWADTVGLEKIVTKLKQMEATDGPEFKPAPLLEKLVAAGKALREV